MQLALFLNWWELVKVAAYNDLDAAERLLVFAHGPGESFKLRLKQVEIKTSI